ncbi:N-acetylglucosamine kinase [Chitinophaga sp. SYP-B3965]|uniref:N-acetylglucosamine kinase n=1 Tax=Chitinophaga sp. SYP-B3965 TaxID=2663120 RepID=UPI001299D63D|nr:N-acetylglucosamine kinase [Chitinophaga sp. SYP-B3965]MRG47094.1 N-acetylglucosamine kinase [Chitinophaga sp. SYP-B3965]
MASKVKLVADSGSTKTEWCLMDGKERRTFFTQGLSPYFLTGLQIEELVRAELLSQLGDTIPDLVFFYGTGCGTEHNRNLVHKSLHAVWPHAKVEVNHDLMGAARALCGNKSGIVSILGTGSNSCYYDGKEIVKNNPGLGYILGDEGSGTFLGKKVVQYYLYQTFDDEMRFRFDQKFNVTQADILENVYRQPLPNRYLAAFTPFLAENRGHYMIENILEDGLNEFFFTHIYKYSESWTSPLHFTGSIAWHFRDILEELCQLYELQLGRILKNPMDGLSVYHEE